MVFSYFFSLFLRENSSNFGTLTSTSREFQIVNLCRKGYLLASESNQLRKRARLRGCYSMKGWFELKIFSSILLVSNWIFQKVGYYRVSKIQVPFLKSYFLLLLGQYFQNLGVHFNPETGDNHIIILADQNSAHIAHTSQMFKITQYFSYLE